MAQKDHCEICEEPGKFDMRISTLEENYDELKEIFREHKKATFQKFDGIQKYLIVNLTAVVIALLLLLANLIVIYGGRK